MTGAPRGTVSLLFTDVVRSTELLEELGDETADELRRSHFRLLRDVVSQWRGREIKSLGDGLMVAFDDARDALSCGVAMQQTVHRHNDEQLPGRQQHLRVGLHVGEAIRREGDYFGTAVVVARRLCDSAQGGQVLASAVIRDLSGPVPGCSFRTLEPVTLKGFSEPFAACEVLWEFSPEALGTQDQGNSDFPGQLPVPPPLVVREGSQFIGREAEHAEIESYWQQVTSGKRQLVLLAGEPGIGKTRLAIQFSLGAYQRGATILLGRCYEQELIPYQPFVEALRYYVAACPSSELYKQAGAWGPALIKLVPEIGHRLPDLPEAPALDPEGERYRFFEAVAALLREASRSNPTVLILDDLHWAATPTIRLLSHLVRAPEQSALLILGTYRESELVRGSPLAEALPDLRRDHAFERISLAGLDEQSVGQLIESSAGIAPPQALRHAVHARTEGNPFFIEEIARDLTEAGAEAGGDGEGLLEAASRGIPEGVRDVIRHRLSRLSTECNGALSIASVIGREFRVDVLERVSDLTADRLLDALDEAVGARVVAETSDAVGRYHFVHALMRETLHEELSAIRRARLHRRIGDVLESDPDVSPLLSELAYHYFEAASVGEATKAVDYAMRAGERAIAHLAYEQAVDHFAMALQALDLTSAPSEQRRCELLLALADAQRRSGEGELAAEAFRDASNLARRLGAADLLARAVLGLGGDWVTGGVVDASLVVVLEEASEALGESDSALKARILSRLAIELRFAPTWDQREAVGEHAVQMARRLQDTALLATALDARHVALWRPQDIDARLAAATEVLDLAHRVGDAELALTGHRWRLRDLLELGRVDEVDAEIETYSRIASELRQPQYVWYEKEFRSMRALMIGRFDQAEELMLECLAIGQRIQHLNAVQWFGVQMATLRRDQGRVDELEPAIAGFVERFPGVRWLAAVAAVYMELGKEAEARDTFEALAAHDFEDLPQDWNWLIAVCLLTEVCTYLGDMRRAELLYELLLPYGERCVVAGPAIACSGSAATYLGLLATALGRWAEAEARFKTALAINERIEAKPWVVRTECHYAALLIARGGAGDRRTARGLLESALRTAEELTMQGLARSARAALAQL